MKYHSLHIAQTFSFLLILCFKSRFDPIPSSSMYLCWLFLPVVCFPSEKVLSYLLLFHRWPFLLQPPQSSGACGCQSFLEQSWLSSLDHLVYFFCLLIPSGWFPLSLSQSNLSACFCLFRSAPSVDGWRVCSLLPWAPGIEFRLLGLNGEVLLPIKLALQP